MSTHPDVVITTYAERPEYIPDAFVMPDTWPDFMRHDEVAAALLGRVIETFPHLNLVATADGEKVARAMAAPFALHTDRRKAELPAAGWDRVLVWAFHDLADHAEPDTVSALEITVHREHLGSGLSHRMLAALRDAWIRTHVRAGAVVDAVAPTSMVITGTLDEWREWTGLPFDGPGEVVVPGALVPVHCVPEHDYAVYVEPNVWLRHRL